MGIVDSIIHPKTFLGITDLRNGSLILAALEFILTVLNSARYDGYGISIGALIAIVCTGLGFWGITENKKNLVRIYEIYLIINAIYAVFVFIFSFFSFSLSYIIKSFFLFVVSLYACRVVRSYYKQMKNDNTTTTIKDVTTTVADKTEEAVDKAKDTVITINDKAEEVADKTKEAVANAADKTKEAVANAADKTKEAATNVADKTKEAVADAAEKVDDAVNKV